MDVKNTQLARTIRVLRKDNSVKKECDGCGDSQVKKTIKTLRGKK